VSCQILPLYQDPEHGAASHYICQVVIESGYDSVPLPKGNAARRPACFSILSLIAFAARVTYQPAFYSYFNAFPQAATISTHRVFIFTQRSPMSHEFYQDKDNEVSVKFSVALMSRNTNEGKSYTAVTLAILSIPPKSKLTLKTGEELVLL
jgi:hypothetical protein